ncbi:MAG: mechanosensitive ion channel [Polaromonas sp.]|uniref:mechanosensitive ion channel family protein n=1 Tax=Polaromonas sp. TaxID=1869339 RepID=UPI0027324D3B|nr:mechanosensitive ion channel domain-containing protein [Polaromonas sp.]MDP2817835.1 mechanosensitive ion channel [Polaromonas sp.]
MQFPELVNLLGWADDSTLRILLVAALALALALLVHAAGSALVLRLTRFMPVAAVVARQCRAPAQLLLPLIAWQAVWQGAPDNFPLIAGVRHGNALLLLLVLTWLGLRAIRGLAQGVIARHPVDVEDNLQARRVHTQTRMLARTAMFVVLLAGVALMLMTFPGARQFGASLLASAGVVGLVVGIAARPVFSNLIAGLQIALAQPIRLDDVLIVQGEWGRVEEITGTYVVLKIWDERRLIIPLQWFIENPFQNWTRKSASIIGTVFLWVDYRMPLAPLRAEAQRVCEASPEWDQRLCLLQVVDAGERSMQLRVLVTSGNASLNWDLRCKVREALVDFMQRDYTQYLPLLRAELASSPSPSQPAPSYPSSGGPTL